MAKGKIGVVVVFPSHFLLLPLPSSGSEEQFVLPKWGADQDSYDSKSSVLWFFLFGGCFLSALGCWLFFFGYFGGTDENLDLKSTGKEIESCIQLKRDKKLLTFILSMEGMQH